MDRTNRGFVPRTSGLASGVALFNRFLTPISVAVGFLGTLLVLLGPVRGLLNSQTGLLEVGTTPATVAEISPAASNMVMSSEGEVLGRGLVPYTIIPDRPRNKVLTYTVQPGDTLMGIAAHFNIDRNTVFWSNADALYSDVHMLVPGMDLYILPVDGVYYRSDGRSSLQSIADKYSVDVNAIINSEFNDLQGAAPTDIPPWGVRIVIPGGTGESINWWRATEVETVDQSTGAISRSFMPNMPGSCAPGIMGAGGTGAWIVPLAGPFSFTQGFYPGHSGIDLAAPVGTQVVAADSGVVVFSGWVADSWGYGILVVLDHGNGWRSYYAHLNSNGVGCGQSVPRGGYIGQVGTTGNSSGPHLHFEMRWGDTPDNPANYIGF